MEKTTLRIRDKATALLQTGGRDNKNIDQIFTIIFPTIPSEAGPEKSPGVMGLLTDPNSGGKGANKLVKLITDYHRPLSWLSYVAGLVFLLG